MISKTSCNQGGTSFFLLVGTLPRRCAGDDPGEIEELDLGLVVVDDAGDARERRELVRCDLAS